MPFPTNGRISDRKKGTLLMDIEKVSEFAREEVESSRYSEKVFINGLPWKILAQIRMKTESTDNDEKCLGFFLLCDSPEKDSPWHFRVHSATFRIISQNNVGENSIGTLSDFVFNTNSTKMGSNYFISFPELMNLSNGFYDKGKDKVTLVIDVTTTDEPKLDKFILDQSKSKGTLFMDIEKVSEFAREVFGSERKSESVTYVKGLAWKIMAEIEKKNESTDNDEKWLGVYLLCIGTKEENWSCKCSAIIRIVSQKSGVADIRREFDDYIFDNKENNWGYNNFISFPQLMKSRNGFYNREEDKVTLAINCTVNEAKTRANDT
ncbi:hypothetical protein niasHT_000469 [Heterodera trifolii]|uniref:MATH domain-containing protein n=1 Tax=Heterodera trifolii TaxID=157864 RepID=A0ABD2LZ06_9BILA